jgi:NTE family protein
MEASRDVMRNARTYDEWKAWAIEEDRRTGADRWKAEDRSRLYDYEVIRRRHDELVEIRASGDAQRLIFYLNEGLHGNMGGMGSPALYARARFGTKHLVTRHIEELVGALHDLVGLDDREIDAAGKRALLRRAGDCYGRSALMLSGAGSLGAFHFGVARALAELDLVPNVVSGASAGSIVAAIMGTHRAEDLVDAFSPDGVALHFDVLRGSGSVSDRRVRIRVENLRSMIEAAIPDLTFGEALEHTGRRINVSVAPAQLYQRSRLLNASTSPNAFVREAVLASCAVPGVFPPVTLAARDAAGRRRPYVPSRRWVDGSITDDLPARRLARLYGVNHFISSQANPISLWARRDPHAAGGLRSRLVDIWLSASQEWLRTIYPFAIRAVRDVPPVATWTRIGFSVMTQDDPADVSIHPHRRLFDPRMLLSALSRSEAIALFEEGERATWPKIEIIRSCTKISRCIDALLAGAEGRDAAAGTQPGTQSGRVTAAW